MSVWAITRSDLDVVVMASKFDRSAGNVIPSDVETVSFPVVALAEGQSTALLTFELAANLTQGMEYDDVVESEYDLLAVVIEELAQNEQIRTDMGERIVFWPIVVLGETTGRLVKW